MRRDSSDSRATDASQAAVAGVDDFDQLLDALAEVILQLDPNNDYVCFNVGNSQIKMFNDAQAEMDSWQEIKENMFFLTKLFNVHATLNFMKAVKVSQNKAKEEFKER